jgi:hypothetical protein
MKLNIRQVVFLIATMLLPAFHLSAQSLGKNKFADKVFYEKQGGNFSFGIRNTLSLFNHGEPSEVGTGLGGHFRLQLVDRVNTELYGDVFLSNIQNMAHREDYHVGWSVMFYLLDTKGFQRKLTPYVVTGHCFDWTKVTINGEGGDSQKRFSSAIQAGLGCHYNVTPRFDISLTTQYMLHLGKEIHAEVNPEGRMEIEVHKHAGWEGHLLVNISANYKIFKVWNRKK